MVDKEDKDIDGQDTAEEGGGPVKDPAKENNKEFSPYAPSDEDLPDDVPAVSISKRKNVVVVAAVILIFTFIMYSLLNKPSKKPFVATELQKMQDTKTQNLSGSVPVGAKIDQNQASVSAGAALPGSSPQGVPEIPFNLADKKNAQASLQETLPPPPTLPPVFDPASIYVKSNDTEGAPPSISSSSLGTFGERYTKKRSRLPELSTGVAVNEDIEGLDPETRRAMEEERKKRVTASMFIGGAKGGAPARKGQKTGGLGAVSGETVKEYNIKDTGAGRTDVSIRRELERVILQGKVMDAVLETAINTDLPGKLRAIVSRDVYSESGKRVVIPKGSRLIGAYATDIKFGQARVYVIWNRVIRPDGVDAIFDSSGDLVAIDALGRSGIYGDLDNRFFEIFGSSILLSSLTVGFAIAADAATGGDNTTTTTTPAGIGAGTNTTSGNVVSQGVSKAVADLGSSTTDIAKQYFKTTPRISVDQGTRIKIFVNKDVIFPPSYFTVGGYNFRGSTAEVIN